MLRCYLSLCPSSSLQCIKNVDFVLVTFVYFLLLRSWTDYLNPTFEAFTELSDSSDFQTYRPITKPNLRTVINRPPWIAHLHIAYFISIYFWRISLNDFRSLYLLAVLTLNKAQNVEILSIS